MANIKSVARKKESEDSMKLDFEVFVKITVIAESESEAEEKVKDLLLRWPVSPSEIEKYQVDYAYHTCYEGGMPFHQRNPGTQCLGATNTD